MFLLVYLLIFYAKPLFLFLNEHFKSRHTVMLIKSQSRGIEAANRASQLNFCALAEQMIAHASPADQFVRVSTVQDTLGFGLLMARKMLLGVLVLECSVTPRHATSEINRVKLVHHEAVYFL